ncbi:MAG: biotin--[acetyl-CoA-carboxylase] ligase [Coriobacteriia bacterium]|nr:biotin--[acetyl-CoA-carboxylase] ligase [Coriobacteriia bacterium]
MSTKEKVLALLESSRGQSISGEHIAEQLGVSRNTIWKAIKELEKDGHKVTAVTNKGYCLSEDSDVLSAQGMASYLEQKELTERIFVYDCLESTNTTAKELAVAGAQHGTVVIANQQTAGKGRYGRNFISPSGSGLYMSIVLCPKLLSFDASTLITACTAVAVCESIEETSEAKPRIKWVNDIFVGDKKVCGISTEAAMDFESGTMQWIVVGIGINLIDPPEGVLQDSRNLIGSIFGADKPSVTRNRLAAEVINRVVRTKEQDTDVDMLARYRQRMFMLGERVIVTGLGDSYEATALDLDGYAQLIVEKDTGEVVTLSSGEVSVRPR